MKIKAVLFDMFDTLMMIEHDHEFYIPSLKAMFYSLKSKGVEKTFAEFKKAYTKARVELYKKADLNNEEPHFNERVAKTLQFLGYNCSEDSSIAIDATFAFCREFMKYVKIDKDSKTVLSQLHKKYVLGIVSNFAIPECVHELLQNHDIKKFFRVIIVSGDVNKRKPSQEIFNYALNKLRIAASEAIFVGDTLDSDIKGAQEVGMKTIFVERRLQKEKELIKPDETVRDLIEILKIIN